MYRVYTFHVAYSNFTCCEYYFCNSTFTLDMLFSSDLSLSAESDQETASLTIDKSPDKFEVGRFVLTIKTENR